MKLQRKLLSLFVAIIILFCCMPSTTQAANANKAITKQINTYFKYVKQYDHVKISNMVVQKGTVPYIKNAYMQRNIAYIQKNSLQYQIDKITVTGKKAKVKVKVLYYTGFNSLSATLKDMLWDAATAKKKINSDYAVNKLASNLKKDFKSDYKHYKKILKKYSDDTILLNKFSLTYANYSEMYIYESFTIPMVKIGNTWKIQKMTSTMRNVYDCDVSFTINDFTKNPYSYLF